MKTSNNSKTKNNIFVEGNVVTVSAPVVGIICNTEKVAKFKTALPVSNDGKGGFCFINVTIFKDNFNENEIDKLDDLLSTDINKYNKKKYDGYSDYLEDCDCVTIGGHLATNEYKGNTTIEIVADRITF